MRHLCPGTNYIVAKLKSISRNENFRENSLNLYADMMFCRGTISEAKLSLVVWITNRLLLRRNKFHSILIVHFLTITVYDFHGIFFLLHSSRLSAYSPVSPTRMNRSKKFKINGVLNKILYLKVAPLHIGWFVTTEVFLIFISALFRQGNAVRMVSKPLRVPLV